MFKITAPRGGALQCNVFTTSFDEVSRHPTLAEHCLRLTLAGLAGECRVCPVVEACGGGSVMHRWHRKRGLEMPSVYCGEIFGVLETATQLLRQSLGEGQAGPPRELVSLTSGGALVVECDRWRQETEARATEAAGRMGVHRNGESAAAILLAERHGEVKNCLVDSRCEDSGRWLNSIILHSRDHRLVTPFLESIRILPHESAQVCHGIKTLSLAGRLLALFQPLLPDALASLISDIVFVESTIESSDRIFSFSDDTAPNVLYIAVGIAPVSVNHD